MKINIKPATPRFININVSIKANDINIFVNIFCSSSGFFAMAMLDKPNKKPSDSAAKASGLLFIPIIMHLLDLIKTIYL